MYPKIISKHASKNIFTLFRTQPPRSLAKFSFLTTNLPQLQMFQSTAQMSSTNPANFSNNNSKQSYKLNYFDVLSLGEPIRWILHYFDIPFEDVRIEWDYPKWLESTKFSNCGFLLNNLCCIAIPYKSKKSDNLVLNFNNCAISKCLVGILAFKQSLGQMPTLQLPDVQILGQSVVISRYLANEFNFEPESNWEKAKTQELVCNIMELFVCKF